MNASDKLANLLMTAEKVDEAEKAMKSHARELLRKAMQHLWLVADAAGLNFLMVCNDPHEDPEMEVTDMIAAQSTDRIQHLVEQSEALVKRVTYKKNS